MNEGKPALKREVGVLGLTAIAVGGIIGSGIFSLTAVMSSVAGPLFLVSMVLLGAVVLLLALPYAELGAAFPQTGGPYVFPRKALGRLGGFTMGWGYFLYAFIGTAAIIDIFVTYLGYYVPGLASGLTLTPLGVVVALAVLATFTVVNVVGVRWGTLFAIVTTVGKLIPILAFTGIGLILLHAGNFAAGGVAPFGWISVGFAMSLGFFSFTGFEAVTIPAEEVRNPRRTIPRVMGLTVGIVTLIYVLLAVAFTGAIRWGPLGLQFGDWGSLGGLSSPLADLANGLGFPVLAAIVAVGAVISTAGAGSNWVLLQGRMPFAMAQDSLFFRAMSRVHPKFGTPHYALMFSSVLTGATLVLIPSFPAVALIASITALVPYGTAALALLVLRRTEPTVDRPWRLPLARVLAPAAFILATVLVYWAAWPWTLVGAAAILVGVPLFFLLPKSEPTGERRGLEHLPWLVTYLTGVTVVSFVGDPFYVYQNFLPVAPLGLLPTPWDLGVLVVFGLGIFYWAYRTAVRGLAVPTPAAPTPNIGFARSVAAPGDR
ncbi:MAG TPA: amino acid permease [Thermoplasmata archaeon]|nr:amino acid permease [Thermoplasmata archaeon]